MDLVKLKTELTTDPLTRGYAAMPDDMAAESLNKPDRSQDVDAIDTGGLRWCFLPVDYATLTSEQKERLAFLFGSHTITLSQNVRSELRNLFPAGNATRTNILAATRRTGSRADELGLGRVTPSDVADARRLTTRPTRTS